MVALSISRWQEEGLSHWRAPVNSPDQGWSIVESRPWWNASKISPKKNKLLSSKLVQVPRWSCASEITSWLCRFLDNWAHSREWGQGRSSRDWPESDCQGRREGFSDPWVLLHRSNVLLFSVPTSSHKTFPSSISLSLENDTKHSPCRV